MVHPAALLLSSHLLGEVQATVDRLVVIGNGRIAANGSLDELLAGGRNGVLRSPRCEVDEATGGAGTRYEPGSGGALG